MAELGDLSGFLKDAGVVDLDWLDIDDTEYRAQDTLPKQNLDIAPDLQAMWSHEDKPTALVPNKDRPQTMGDLSQAHGKLAMSLKTAARLHLYGSSDVKVWFEALASRFGRDTLRAHKAVLADVLEERGLLGKLYIAASDFANCSGGSKTAQTIVAKVASGAPYVLAKAECATCIHATKSVTGTGQTCAVFHKELVLEVPYSPALANRIEKAQAAQGKDIKASDAAAPKERIRLAMLAPNRVDPTLEAMKPKEHTARLLKTHRALPVIQNAPPIPKMANAVITTLRREMLKGLPERSVIAALKVAHPIEQLRETRQYWEPVFNQAGLYGVVYATQDSFSDCHDGVDFLSKYNPGIRGIVAGSKCESCFFNKAGRCMMYGKKLVRQASDLMTPEVVQEVIREQRLAGRLETGAEKVAWGETPSEALREIYRVASKRTTTPMQRMVIERSHATTATTTVTSGLTRRDIIKTARRYLNEGLYGEDLLSLLKSRYDVRDLTAAKTELRSVLAEQGLQGVYYIDPTIYSDYGKGCNEAERLHRSRGVPYVKAASACDSCVHQAAAGHCSKINKPLVAEVPYIDKAAQQREILATGKSTEVPYDKLINNGLTVMAEYQIQHGMADVEINDQPIAEVLDIEFGSAGQGVKL